jgi:hypothetical protein
MPELNHQLLVEVAKIQYVVGTICNLMIEINDLLDQIYKDHEKAIKKLADKGKSVYVEFYKYVDNVRTQCHQSYRTLENIKSELLTAKMERAFDQIVSREIYRSSKAMLATFEASEERRQKIVDDIFACKDGIIDEEKGIKRKGIRNRFLSVVYNGVCENFVTFCAFAGAAMYPVEDFNNFFILSIAGGAITAAGLGKFIEYRKINEINNMKQKLEQVNDKMNDLFNHVDIFGDQVRKVTENIQDYVECAGEITEHPFQTSDKAVEEAIKMIEKTDTLQNGMQQIEGEATRYCDHFRAIIRLESPKSLAGI